MRLVKFVVCCYFAFPRRAALEKWKQRLGSKATYRRLIGVFECANYKGYAEKVRSIVERAVTKEHTRKLSNLDHSSSQLEGCNNLMTSDLQPPVTNRLKQEGNYLAIHTCTVY